MSDRILEYALQDGYIHNWLVAGPQASAIGDLDRSREGELPAELAQHHHRRFSDVNQPPVELATFQIGEAELTWQYHRCQDDHLVDLSATYSTPHYLRSWAYARLASPSVQQVAFHLSTYGPVDVWLNREHVHRHARWGSDLQSSTLASVLHKDVNEILVRFEALTIRECPYAVALQLEGPAIGDLSVQLPTYHENARRRQKLELVYEQAHLEHMVSVRGAGVSFCWDDPIEYEDQVGYWVRNSDTGLITVYGNAFTKPGERVRIGEKRVTLEQGPHHIVLIPPSQAVEHYGIRYQRQLPFYVLDRPFSGSYYGSDSDRRAEALEHSVQREGQLYAEVARVALGRWAAIDLSVVQHAIDRVLRREGGSALDLLGLLGIAARHPQRPILPQHLDQVLEQGTRAYRYWSEDPGADAMAHEPESQAILYHACEILAGQRYPEDIFARTQQAGRWHRERGEQLAREWLHERGRRGFTEWDAPACVEREIVALTHLADLAVDTGIQEWAQIVLDKLCFTMAVNSYRGLYASAQCHATAAALKSGQLEATSGIARLLWGTGAWNQHIAGPVSLAMSGYELPSMIASIAVDLDEEMWHRERQPGVHKVTYRTPDSMLCSAVDYRRGERGYDEQVWQATLGPGTSVFVNHPSCMSESDAHKPNFWAGNRVLPRVAQYKDTLVAVHKLPPDDWMGFCHAHFPVHEFEEWELTGEWAVARVGQAYVALCCSRPLELIKRGPGAYRELRAAGTEQIWLCMVGREATDGPFCGFRDRIMGLGITWRPLGVTCRTHRDQSLSFGWESPFLVDGAAQPLAEDLHYDGPHCRAEWPCAQMDVQYGDYTLRLSFEG